MLLNIQEWTDDFIKAMKQAFGDDLLFVGLQGSYGRGEAGESSDVDMVVVLKTLSFNSLKTYGEALKRLPNHELACGFVSDRETLSAWKPSELFALYCDTVPLFGDIDFIKDSFTSYDATDSVKEAACAVYHAACHNCLYEKSPEILKALLKSVFFALRAKVFCKTGRFVKRSDALAAELTGHDAEMLRCWIAIKAEREISSELFDAVSEALIKWSSENIRV